MTNYPIFKGYLGLTETSKSGFFTYGERILYHFQCAGSYSDGANFAAIHPRWSQWTLNISGTLDFAYVHETRLSREIGGKGVVDIDFISLSTLPPNEFALVPYEINPAIEQNPYFTALTDQERANCHSLFTSATLAGQDSIANVTATLPHASICTDLINAWRKGQETYYLSGYKFIWTEYAIEDPEASKGGYTEFPFGPFDDVIPSNLSWLRQADDCVWSGGLWKITRTWVGAPDGFWDPKLYPSMPPS